MTDKKPEEYFTTAPKRSKWESFGIFMWNSETKQFMGRTAGSWAKIITFYIIFYAFLAGFFAAMLAIFYQTLDYRVPKWQNVNGLIGTNPGLGFRPMPPDDKIESTLISFRHGTGGNWKHWTNSMEKFLKPYEELSSSGEYFTACDFEKAPQAGKVCNFDITLLGNQCTKERNFGYDLGKPCVLIKLNKIFGWVPEPFNSSAVLPEEMPFELKEHVKSVEATNVKQMNMIWLSCEGETAADKENIGNVTYTPFRGFPGYYYPYQNIPGYLTPVVALEFTSLKNGVAVNVECKAWANNVSRDRQRRLGSVHFELLMD